MADVEVLLEVVAQREDQERALVGGQLHRGGQAALDDGEVAGGEVLVEVVHVGADLEPGMRGQRRGVDARAGDDDHAQVRDLRAGGGEGVDHAAQQRGADAGAADGDDADPLAGPVAERRAQPFAVADRGEAGDVAGEVEVLLGPVADRGQLGAEALVDDVVGVADEQRAVAQSRVAVDVLDHLGVVVGGQRALVLDRAASRRSRSARRRRRA